MPGFVYGGLFASLVDCHAMGTPAAFVERAEGRNVGDGPEPRFVTASLNVEYVRPTPHGPQLELRGRATEIGARKVTVEVECQLNRCLSTMRQYSAVPRPGSVSSSRKVDHRRLSADAAP